MPPRLLVVEDDDSIPTALRWALEDEGYTAAEAVNGEDARRYVAESAPDLMLVDLMLGPTRTTSSRRSRRAPTTT